MFSTEVCRIIVERKKLSKSQSKVFYLHITIKWLYLYLLLVELHMLKSSIKIELNYNFPNVPKCYCHMSKTVEILNIHKPILEALPSDGSF